MDQVWEMLCDCLEQKKKLFEEYAAHTNEMTSCEIEELDYYITQRAELAIEIDQLDVEISAICDSDPEGELLRDAVANRGSFGDYSDELQQVYEAAGRIFSVINKVYRQEPQVISRMEEERDRLREKIKEESNTPKMVKYVRGLASPPETGIYFGDKYDKI